MEDWSVTPLDNFQIKIFVDTNILCYLIDETYPSLNLFFQGLKEMQFVNLISSDYVLFEFIGVRKKEHYLREAVKKRAKEISSLLKDTQYYELPEINFQDIIPIIKEEIDKEKEQICSEFGISFTCGFHEKLYNPTSDICLSSKISREDSLVLISSLFKDSGTSNNDVVLFTNDEHFSKWFYESETIITQILGKYNIEKPKIQDIRKLEYNNKKSNICSIAPNDIKQCAIDYISNLLAKKGQNVLLGITFKESGSNIPDKCICFKGSIGLEIPNNKYVTIIGKDLDFIYYPSHKIELWCSKKLEAKFFNPTEGNNNLSFMIEDELDERIIERLKEPGNYIYLHPHN